MHGLNSFDVNENQLHLLMLPEVNIKFLKIYELSRIKIPNWFIRMYGQIPLI